MAGKKINILVLMGGKSPEHNVSLASGKEVVRNLDPLSFNALPVIVSKDGLRWSLSSKKSILELPDTLSAGKKRGEIVPRGSVAVGGMQDLGKRGIDVVFIAMHGPFGEDGTVQGLLDLSGVKYTGSGVLASAVGMDKVAFRKIMKAEKIPSPKYIVIGRKDKIGSIRKKIKKLGNYPYFVKPHNQGSSVGAGIAKDPASLGKLLLDAFSFSDKVLIDEYIRGMELTCGIMGNDDPFPLPLVEIVPKSEFFDYKSKYTESGAEEIVPARIGKGMTRRIQEIAVKAYKAIGCRGFSRVDFILKDSKHPYVLEINTIPGLTPVSLLPKAAEAYGYTYAEFLKEVVKYALEGKN